MTATVHSLRFDLKRTVAIAKGFLYWLRTHRGAVTMAGLLSFAVPVTLFPGAVTVMREPTAENVMMLASWYVLYGVELWGLLLVIGYAFQRQHPNTRYARAATTLIGSCAAVACVEISTAGRGRILVEQGVVLEQSINALCMRLFLASSWLCFSLRTAAQSRARGGGCTPRHRSGGTARGAVAPGTRASATMQAHRSAIAVRHARRRVTLLKLRRRMRSDCSTS
jgi:hypothetical protein